MIMSSFQILMNVKEAKMHNAVAMLHVSTIMAVLLVFVNTATKEMVSHAVSFLTPHLSLK